MIEREERGSFWRVYGGEKGRKKRVGNGVRVLRWGCGMEWSLEGRKGVGVRERLWGMDPQSGFFVGGVVVFVVVL